MPQWYIDWLIATLVPLALRGSWEAGIDPLDPGYEPQTQPEQHGVGIVGKWALEKALSPNWREELAPADYAMSFWYVIDREESTVGWQVLGETIFCCQQERNSASSLIPLPVQGRQEGCYR